MNMRLLLAILVAASVATMPAMGGIVGAGPTTEQAADSGKATSHECCDDNGSNSSEMDHCRAAGDCMFKCSSLPGTLIAGVFFATFRPQIESSLLCESLSPSGPYLPLRPPQA